MRAFSSAMVSIYQLAGGANPSGHHERRAVSQPSITQVEYYTSVRAPRYCHPRLAMRNSVLTHRLPSFHFPTDSSTSRLIATSQPSLLTYRYQLPHLLHPPLYHVGQTPCLALTLIHPSENRLVSRPSVVVSGPLFYPYPSLGECIFTPVGHRIPT